MRHILIAVLATALLCSCAERAKNTAEAARPETAEQGSCPGGHDHDHDHEGHDHESHDHTGHDHTGHDHSAHGDEEHDHGETEAGESEDPDEIVFTAEQASRTDFAVEEVVLSTFHAAIKTGGRIMPAQGDEVSVAAPAAGIVSFAGTGLSDGSQVSRGQRLFYISTKNIASGDLLSRNRAAYEKARGDYERAGKLLADRIVSQKEYDETKLAYENARAEYSAFAGSSSASGIGVSTPIAGYVGSLAVNEGDFVEMGATLATVTQNRTLMLRAEVSQRYLPELRTVTGANFTDSYSGTTFKLSEMDGKLLSVGRIQTAANSLIPVTFQFRNTGNVLPGTYVEVALLGQAEDNVLAVPLSAVTEQQGLYYVYVQLDRDCYRRQEVRLGADDGDRVRILSGLAAGDRVVTRGAVNVRMAAASGSIPHTHEH